VKSVDTFLDHRVRKLIEGYLVTKPDALPVDLDEVARLSGVLSIEEREMIPEAVLSPGRKGFRIYLQSNFIGDPNSRVRRRFSLAHEIAHTLFYDLRGGVPKPVAKSPRGDDLEDACHRGARLLLIPQRFLAQELRRIGQPIGADHVIELSRKFEVSVEAMLRRLDQAGAFESAETALVLVRSLERRNATIKLALPYPPWLKVLMPPPSRDVSFASWLRPSVPDVRQAEPRIRHGSDRDVDVLFDKGLQLQTNLGTLRVSPFSVTRSQHVFELRLE